MRNSSLFIYLILESIWCTEISRAADFKAYQWYGNAYHVSLNGPIVLGDEDKFRQLILTEIHAGHLVSGVQLNSPGGSVGAAISIGEVIRQLQASTFAPLMRSGTKLCKTGSLDNEAADSNSYCECASACSLIWEGGIGRLGDVVGIHRVRYDEASFKTLTPDQATTLYDYALSESKAYFAKMGVPDWLFNKMYSIPSSDMYYMSAAELQQFSNSSPALGELVIARCGNFPTGTIYDSPARKQYLDCNFAISMAPIIKGNAEYASMVGGSGDAGRTFAWMAPTILTPQRPTVPPVAPSVGPGPSVTGPSFDCARASQLDELTICRNGRLSDLDRRLSDLFKATRTSDGFAAILSAQRAWLARRASCTTNAICISSAYETRIAELEQASSPGPSFSCGGPLNPDETAICRSAQLSAYDRRLNALYSVAKNTTGNPDLVQHQRAWLGRRKGCQSDVSCLMVAYQSRIYQLEGSR
jgi:uncharacterized protein